MIIRVKETEPFESKPSRFEDFLMVCLILAFAFIVMAWFGRAVLLLFNYKVPNLVYASIFGIGIVSAATFIWSGISEIISSKGEHDEI